jgi:glycoprotein endo-alpha-1,2-mannosidase
VAGAAAIASIVVPAGSGSDARRDGSDVGQVAIFYYPWYSTPRRDGSWAHWYVRRDGEATLSTRFFPARGLYSSSDPSVVEAQMREIATTGIDTVIVSWWGRGSPEADRLPLVLSSAKQNGLLVAAHIEPYTGRTPVTTAADIEQLAAEGIGDFYVYAADADTPSAWAAALSGLQGVRVFGQTNYVGRAKASGFAGLYSYDVGTWNGGTFARMCREAHAAGLRCAPSVGPGYDARLATGDQLVRERGDGTRYDHMWRWALRANADLVTITSYNEWQEGTQIEPARSRAGRPAYDGAWGREGAGAQRAYLDATARWTARAHGLVTR